MRQLVRWAMVALALQVVVFIRSATGACNSYIRSNLTEQANGRILILCEERRSDEAQFGHNHCVHHR